MQLLKAPHTTAGERISEMFIQASARDFSTTILLHDEAAWTQLV